MFKPSDVVFRIKTTPGEMRFAKRMLVGMTLITVCILFVLAILP